MSVRETRTLDESRAEMTVETLLVVQHGYSFRGARNYGRVEGRLPPRHALNGLGPAPPPGRPGRGAAIMTA